MGIERLLWLAILAGLPGAVLTAYLLGLQGNRLSNLATACAVALTVVSALPLAAAGTYWTFGPLRFGPLSFVLVPFAALLWLLTVIVTPSSRRDDAGFARTAAACLLHMTAFMTARPELLIAIWVTTSLLLAASHREARFAGARRIAIAYLGPSAAILAAGAVLAARARGANPVLEQCGIALILLAVMMRNGIFPFHAWIPEVFDQGRIGPSARFHAPQIGTYAALVMAVPHAQPGLLRTVAVLGLLTAVYSSFMALYQRDARRACGYLFVSQSSLVIAGLDIPSRNALIGALILWVCSGVALAGFARAVLALEARRGRLRLDVHHGGYERMPQLAVCFLIMSLAIANFPGTLGFVGGEMLVRGAVDSFPWLGLFAVVATAVNGLAAIRMYFSLFCGKKDSGAHLSLKRMESFGFAAAALVLLGFGLAPNGLVRVLTRAGAAVMDSRR